MAEPLFLGELVESSRILYTPSHFATRSLMYLQEIGTLKARKPHTSRRNGLESCLFFMVLDGSGQLQYEGRTYSLTAGDCAFLNCRREYAHTSSEQLWNLKWIHFYGAGMDSIYEKYRERGGKPCFRPMERQFRRETPWENLLCYLDIWERLNSLAASEDPIRDMRINEELSALLTLLMEDSWNPAEQSPAMKRQDLLEIRNYLDEHYAEKITLERLSSRFYINKYTLLRSYQKQFGTTPNQYLLLVRITKAKQLLRFSNDTVEAIGAACGLGTNSYFSRTFKKVEGCSPGEFRKKWREP